MCYSRLPECDLTKIVLKNIPFNENSKFGRYKRMLHLKS